MKKLYPLYKRYVKRVDQLKTNKQKLLAICRLKKNLPPLRWKQSMSNNA